MTTPHMPTHIQQEVWRAAILTQETQTSASFIYKCVETS